MKFNVFIILNCAAAVKKNGEKQSFKHPIPKLKEEYKNNSLEIKKEQKEKKDSPQNSSFTEKEKDPISIKIFKKKSNFKKLKENEEEQIDINEFSFGNTDSENKNKSDQSPEIRNPQSAKKEYQSPKLSYDSEDRKSEEEKFVEKTIATMKEKLTAHFDSLNFNLNPLVKENWQRTKDQMMEDYWQLYDPLPMEREISEVDENVYHTLSNLSQKKRNTLLFGLEQIILDIVKLLDYYIGFFTTKDGIVNSFFTAFESEDFERFNRNRLYFEQKDRPVLKHFLFEGRLYFGKTAADLGEKLINILSEVQESAYDVLNEFFRVENEEGTNKENFEKIEQEKFQEILRNKENKKIFKGSMSLLNLIPLEKLLKKTIEDLLRSFAEKIIDYLKKI